MGYSGRVEKDAADARLSLVRNWPEGFHRVRYEGRGYGMTVSWFNRKQSVKIFAEAPGSGDVISANIYWPEDVAILRPCEMSDVRVLHFLQHVHEQVAG